MCGIAGFWSTPAPAGVLKATAIRMAQAIAHRGPDDHGSWVDPNLGLALAHRRLSIIDLSAAGHQPMQSGGGRFIATFNGEIYNHVALRKWLEQEEGSGQWVGHSDTETLLACIEAWGLAKTLERCVGMFALALWDIRDQSLYLARDRFGEKPLYYGWADRGFFFASELKALCAHGGWKPRICDRALAEYLRLTYVPAPLSIYQDVYKLQPGCILQVRGAVPPVPPRMPLAAPASYGTMTVTRWWSLAETVRDGSKDRFQDDDEGLTALKTCLVEAVKLQSLADVPLGAFLSGGVDSSAIAALMQEQNSRPVKTFTVGFDESSHDEAPYARAVADHLGTEHHELRVTADEARAVIPQLGTMYDEPFADSSQIPTHLVCRAARMQVTVALSGDAGDEMFGGYNRYLWAPRVWSKVRWLPRSTRGVVSRGLAAVALATEHRNALGLIGRPAEKMRKLSVALEGARSLDSLYEGLVACWGRPEEVMSRPVPPIDSHVLKELPAEALRNARARMMFRDSVSYLPDDILCKVDRAAMAIGLETRVPFLDHRVAEVAWRLPMHMKIRGSVTKWALRQILYTYVPSSLVDRPKTGFAVPIAAWLRGPLRAWAEDLLSEARLRRGGHFQAEVVRTAWQEHLSGYRDWSQRLWCILMFESWLDANGRSSD